MWGSLKKFFALLSIAAIIFCIIAIVRVINYIAIDHRNIAAYAFVILLGIITIVINLAFLYSLWVNNN